jgi:hypothetical protein
MSDVVGRLGTLTVIAPVQAGREAELSAALAALGQGADSPFAAVRGTQLARLVVIDRLPFVELRRAHLLFGAAFDGPDDGYLAALHDAIGDTVQQIWGHCADFPDGADAAAFTTWMLARRIRARAVLGGHPGAPLHEIREAVELRRRIGRFAARWQGRSPEALHAAFTQEFLEP